MGSEMCIRDSIKEVLTVAALFDIILLTNRGEHHGSSSILNRSLTNNVRDSVRSITN